MTKELQPKPDPNKTRLLIPPDLGKSSGGIGNVSYISTLVLHLRSLRTVHLGWLNKPTTSAVLPVEVFAK